MINKRTFNIALGFFTFIAMVLFSFSSCDKVEEPYSITLEKADTAACPIPEFPLVTQVKKRVLLEDYTGHTCVNCPEAALIAHNLKTIHGDQLVVLSVHAGYFAEPSLTGNYAYDFRTEAGNTWNTFYGIIANPTGLINRKGYPGNHLLSAGAWTSKVSSALSETPVIDLQMINSYDGESRKLCTHINTRFITNLDLNLKLIVVLSESKIIKPQKNSNAAVGPKPDILDYEHNHVLRQAITLPWGTKVAAVGVANPESLIKTFKIILDEEYLPENCSVVAFVYDESTTEVLQVIEMPVMQ